MRRFTLIAALAGLFHAGVHVGGVVADTPVEADALRERVAQVQLGPPILRGNNQFVHVKPPPQAGTEGVWRLWLQAPAADAPVVLRDAANGGRVAPEIPPDAARRGTWSADLPPRQVVITAPKTFHIEVRLRSWNEVTIDTQTPVGELNLTDVLPDALPLRLRRHIPGVGLLRLLKTPLPDVDEKAPPEFIYCTTFLVTDRHALTAAHCVDIGLDNRMADIRLGHIARVEGSQASLHHVALVDTSETLDLAILELDPPASSQAAFKLSPNDPENRSEAMVLQHFSAKPLSISDDVDCVVLNARYDGPSVWNAENQRAHSETGALFAHGCDTTSTSSGSPVLDRSTFELIGMHQQGYHEGGIEHNRALRVNLIRDYLTDSGVLAMPASTTALSDKNQETSK